MNKILTSFRLTKVVISILEMLAKKQQLTKTDIITLAVMDYASDKLSESQLQELLHD